MSQTSSHIITFDSTEQDRWMKVLLDAYYAYREEGHDERVWVACTGHVRKEQLLPFHLVTLACLIQHLFDCHWRVFMSNSNREVVDFIVNDLQYQKYWSGGRNHVDAKDSGNIFNLWRILDEEKEEYGKKVETYFQETYFKQKDLSALSITLHEAFYNVFDHAEAKNNAFVILQFDQHTEVLRMAICDFGKGIVNSVKSYDSLVNDDEAALLKSIENNFTVKSMPWNGGKGLGNIIANTDVARICSGRAVLTATGADVSTLATQQSFPGTLICLEVYLSQLEDVGEMEEFDIWG